MRTAIDGLESPAPLSAGLPAVYLEDELAQRLLAALDEVLAPILCTLDNLEAYFDPSLAPADFVEWLASWVGLRFDEAWDIAPQRAQIGEATELYRWRGTVRGMAEHVALYTGVRPEIDEGGGAAWSPTPEGRLPGKASTTFTVTVRVPAPSAIDHQHVDSIVAATKPAHLEHRLKVVGP